MKTKINTFTHYAVLLMFCAFFMNSCEKSEDAEPDPVQEVAKGFNAFMISNDDLERNEALKNTIINDGSSNARDANTGRLNTIVHYDTYDFSIETDYVAYVETLDKTYHSYTFPVIRDTTTSVTENLLLSLEKDGSYTASLIAYEFTMDQKRLVYQNEYVSLLYKTTTTSLENFNSSAILQSRDYYYYNAILNYCYKYEEQVSQATGWTILVEVEVPCGGGEDASDGSAGEGDNNGDDEGEDGNGFGEEDNHGPGNIGGSGGPNGDSPDDDPPFRATTPVVPPEEVIKDCLNEIMLSGNSNVDILGWLDNATVHQKKAVANYLNSNSSNPLANSDTNCEDPVALDFVVEAIEILLGGYNDLTIDELLEVLGFEQDYRNKMSDSEIDLFDTLTRDKQLNYLWSAKQASDKTEELFSTYCEKYNGKGDAFRHAYWNALSSSRIGVGLTNLLTTRHEDKPPTYPYNSKENVMDLYNNEIGRDIIWNGSTDILQDVLSAFNNGDLRYLSNQASDCRATYNSQLTPTNQ